MTSWGHGSAGAVLRPRLTGFGSSDERRKRSVVPDSVARTHLGHEVPRDVGSRGSCGAARSRLWPRRAGPPTRCRAETPCLYLHCTTPHRRLDTPFETPEDASSRQASAFV